MLTRRDLARGLLRIGPDRRQVGVRMKRKSEDKQWEIAELSRLPTRLALLRSLPLPRGQWQKKSRSVRLSSLSAGALTMMKP